MKGYQLYDGARNVAGKGKNSKSANDSDNGGGISQKGGISVNVGVNANGNVVTVRGNKYPAVLSTVSCR